MKTQHVCARVLAAERGEVCKSCLLMYVFGILMVMVSDSM